GANVEWIGGWPRVAPRTVISDHVSENCRRSPSFGGPLGHSTFDYMSQQVPGTGNGLLRDGRKRKVIVPGNLHSNVCCQGGVHVQKMYCSVEGVTDLDTAETCSDVGHDLTLSFSLSYSIRPTPD